MPTVNPDQDGKVLNPLRGWNIDQNGQIRWKRRCDFTGEEYDVIEGVLEEECGKVCLIDSNGCTHFVSLDGSCYLKKLDDPKMEMIDYEARCGFIVKGVCIPITISKFIKPSVISIEILRYFK